MEIDLEKFLKTLETDGLIQARVNYKGKESEFDKEPHGSGVLEQVDNKLYIQALEFTADGEIEKAVKLLEALILVDPSHKKGKELLEKLKRKEKIKKEKTEEKDVENLKGIDNIPVQTEKGVIDVFPNSDNDYNTYIQAIREVKSRVKEEGRPEISDSRGIFIRFFKSLWRHIPFLIILGISSYLFYLAYGAKTSWGTSILLGFIGAFIPGYLAHFINNIIDKIKNGQMLILLMILGGVIIFLLFKYLVVPFFPDKEVIVIFIYLHLFIFGIGALVGGRLGKFVRDPEKFW